MQYLLLCYMEESLWEKLPPAERDDVMRAYGRWAQDIAKRGVLRAEARLAPSASATTVRERNGRRAITDGPFAETKEQLGGYHLIECPDLDEALACAGRVPTLRVGGTIEVRPVEVAFPR
jgi:hypothetical protein